MVLDLHKDHLSLDSEKNDGYLPVSSPKVDLYDLLSHPTFDKNALMMQIAKEVDARVRGHRNNIHWYEEIEINNRALGKRKLDSERMGELQVAIVDAIDSYDWIKHNATVRMLNGMPPGLPEGNPADLMLGVFDRMRPFYALYSNGVIEDNPGMNVATIAVGLADDNIDWNRARRNLVGSEQKRLDEIMTSFPIDPQHENDSGTDLRRVHVATMMLIHGNHLEKALAARELNVLFRDSKHAHWMQEGGDSVVDLKNRAMSEVVRYMIGEYSDGDEFDSYHEVRELIKTVGRDVGVELLVPFFDFEGEKVDYGMGKLYSDLIGLKDKLTFSINVFKDLETKRKYLYDRF